MSADSLWAELERSRRIIAQLTAEKAALKAQFEDLLSPPRRRSYGDGPREEDTGRRIMECARCGRVLPMRGLGLCGACYERRRRALGRVREKLGTMETRVEALVNASQRPLTREHE